ncbi:MAG: gluconate 2-dehydrogenase subunit 3 family protein [Gemmatimonadota bacterium]
MHHDSSGRREFIARSGSALGGAWLLRQAPLVALAQACAREVQPDDPFAILTDREAADLDALAARIVPSDDTPGAREAGVVRFADRALGTFLSDMLTVVRDGLADLAQRATNAAGASATFTSLTLEQQDALVSVIETERADFFFVARTLAVLCLVSNPEYGGNQDLTGWRLIGFEEQYAYQPPFGFYDRGEHGTAGVGA